MIRRPSRSISLPRFGQQISIRNAPINRRRFLGVAAFGLLLAGCRDNSKPAPQKPTLRFQELHDQLNSLWGVRDAKDNGPRTVIVFANAHTPVIEQQNIARVHALERIFDLDVVGLENYIEGPKGTLDLKSHEAFWKAMEYDESRQLVLQGATQEGPSLPEPSQGLDELFQSGDFVTLPLENYEAYTNGKPGAMAEEIITLWMDVVGLGYLPLVHGDKKHWTLLQWERIEAFYKERVPGFPVFDLSRLTHQKARDGKEVIILGRDHNAVIGQLAFEFRCWFQLNHVIPRNRILIDQLTQQMQERGAMRGAFVVGADHTRQFPGAEGQTVQEILDAKGFSYLVIDY